METGNEKYHLFARIISRASARARVRYATLAGAACVVNVINLLGDHMRRKLINAGMKHRKISASAHLSTKLPIGDILRRFLRTK